MLLSEERAIGALLACRIMADLTSDDVLRLIRDVEEGNESAAEQPLVASAGPHPPHMVWGIGAGQPVAVAVTAQGLEFRTGEYWATGWGDLESTDDPWVIEGIVRNAVALRHSIDVTTRNRAVRAAREDAAKTSTAERVIDYLEAPGPESFETTLTEAAIWVDHRDEDATIVAAVARKLPAGSLTVADEDGVSFTVTGPRGSQRIAPMNRDVTLRAIAAVIGPEAELRLWIDSPLGDTVAIIVVSAPDILEITRARSERALNSRFRRIGPRSRIFT